jgi:hypothetical protein
MHGGVMTKAHAAGRPATMRQAVVAPGGHTPQLSLMRSRSSTWRGPTRTGSP